MKNWSGTHGVQTGHHSKAFNSLFSSNRKILHLFQSQPQIKHDLMNSQQLTPQIQTFMLKISESTNASTQSSSGPLWQIPFKKLFGLEIGLLNKKARTLQINTKWILMTFLLFLVNFIFHCVKRQQSKYSSEKWKITRCPGKLWSSPPLRYSKTFLGNLI